MIQTQSVTLSGNPDVSTVYYTVVDALGNVLIPRDNSGVSAGSGGIYSVTFGDWNPNWSGQVNWDISNVAQSSVAFTWSRSFSSVADANVYFAGRLYATAWTTSTTQNQQAALNGATEILMRLAWLGIPSVQFQPLPWPRSGLYMEQVSIDSTAVPFDILNAQYELALALLKGYDPERDARGAAVTSRGYSSVRVAYAPALVPDYVRFGIPSLAAWNLILPYLDMDQSEAIRLHRVS